MVKQISKRPLDTQIALRPRKSFKKNPSLAPKKNETRTKKYSMALWRYFLFFVKRKEHKLSMHDLIFPMHIVLA